MTNRALFVGDASLDLTMVVDHVPAPDEKVHVNAAEEAPGGVVANAAVACARTGVDATAMLQLGDDAAANQIVAGLERQAVTTDVRRVAGATCRVVVILERDGEKRLLLDPGVSMYPSETQIAGANLGAFAWVHTASYGPAAFTLIERCRAHGIAWSLDLEPASFAQGLDVIAPLLSGARIIFCNDRAAIAIGGDAVQHLRDLGAETIVRTMGRVGARLYRGGTEIHSPAPALAAVLDTTGAGDCLAGWLIGEILSGTPERAALDNAVLAASLSCLNLGAQHSYPHPVDLERWRRANRPASRSSTGERS